MDSEPVSRARRKHTNGWMTVLALGLLGAGLLACLYVLIGVPAQAQTVGDSTTEPTASAPAPAAPVYRRREPPCHRGRRAQSCASGAGVRRPFALRYRDR